MSTSRRILIIDCNGIIKRFQYFNTNQRSFYSFDRFCNVLIESIFRFEPSIIYTTQSSPIQNLWRHQQFPDYQSDFIASTHYAAYNENVSILDELPQHIDIINHIQCPMQMYESGDLASSIIRQYTTENDQVFVLAQAKKFQQMLKHKHVRQVIVTRKDEQDHMNRDDDELNFSFKVLEQNTFGLSTNEHIIDYLSLIGIKSDNICGIKGIGPVRAKKLLDIGDISFLLNNQEWKSEERGLKAVTKLIEENAELLKFFCNELIPFYDGIEIEDSLQIVKNVPNDYYECNDSLSLLESIRPIAEKYDLKSIKWRLKQHRQTL